jgi:hypothetical protein
MFGIGHNSGMFLRDMPNEQAALSFLVSQITYIEPTVYRIKYPELFYRELVPVDSTGTEWAKSITFFSIDQVGAADWFHAQAADIPLADVTRAKHEVAIEMGAIGYRYNTEELAQGMMIPNFSLSTERASAARRASEEFLHNIAIYGNTQKSWHGLVNSPGIPVINTAHTWAYDMAQAPPLTQNLMNDVNFALTNIWQSTLGIEMSDVVLLPFSAMAQIAMAQLPATSMNILQWIKQNNIVTQQTGQQIEIRAVRGLDTGGVSGNGRIVAYKRDPEIIKMHVPMPHRFLPVWQRGPLVYDVPGIFRVGGLEIRRPATMRYVDGVC